MTTSTTMKISLPKAMRDDVKKLVSESRAYSTTSSFLQDLMRRELALVKEKQKLNSLVDKGIALGISKNDPDTFFKTLLK